MNGKIRPGFARPAALLALALLPILDLAAQALRVETLIEGLDTPWAAAFAPDGRLFINERGGRISTWRAGRLSAWAELPVQETGEGGLLGLALDPGFESNGFVYVMYTYRGENGLANRIARLRDSAGRGTGEKIILDGIPAGNNHDGGRLAFGPDGKLYATTGDSYREDLAQDPASPAGKILRLERDGSAPADNPFPGSRVYSLGHRNPQGLAWQPGSGRLYATEHGPSGFQGSGQDEVNLIAAGKNYGWPRIRGDERAAGLEAPLVHSGRGATWAPGGAAFPVGGPWAGSLVFAGLRGRSLYRIELASDGSAGRLEALFAGSYGRLRDVVAGPDGALYLLTSNRDGRGSPAAGDDRVLRLSWD